ncbi:MAG: UvrD-helicase domain-containing protein [Planctomycetota bacterium]|nr:UvrD-helicase domain-containing protein [Planctomycetota bacterium]
MTPFYADLHIHSRYSRATSRDCDLEHLTAWAKRKGITLLGTGDITHPAWQQELREKLQEAEPGLFRLRPNLLAEVDKEMLSALRPAEGRFILQGEISTIYKRDGRTRKVHHIVFLPTLASAERLAAALSRIGNLAADGRPILGLDSRDLLEIVLQAEENAFLIPAHVWTPWFSLFGSMSGFDTVEECYADLTSHIFALETGLSSDPAMNWRLSALDRYRLVSNSDTHSPQKIGREACVFAAALDFYALRRALQTGEGYGGTIEFFPEEGKYHLDGHRKCNLRWTPEETRRHQGICQVCGQPVTIGVMHRVEELADRPEGSKPEAAAPYCSLIPLAEILGELHGCGETSKAVQNAYQRLLATLGPEIFILQSAPLADVERQGGEILAEALRRMRAGKVIREAGYDGEYGVIRLFAEGEIAQRQHLGSLFALPPLTADTAERQVANASAAEKRKRRYAVESAPPQILADDLDAEQRAAVEHGPGPLLIVAGPGTGKTRTLTQRLADIVRNRGVAAEACLAITFTRRAAEEMAARLVSLLGSEAGKALVTTFHGLGLRILQEQAEKCGLGKDAAVASDEQRAEAAIAAGAKPAEAERWLERISLAKRGAQPGADAETVARYDRFLHSRQLVDFDDLILLPLRLLEENAAARRLYQERWQWLFVDELQDIDPLQYRLLRCLAAADANLCAIGDPDQSIYGFRGSDVGLFARFCEDFPNCRVIILQRNYRSTSAIVNAAMQAIGPESLARGRQLSAVCADDSPLLVRGCPTDKAEAEFVVETIEKLLAGHSFFSLDSGRGQGGMSDLSFGDFAVLYRTAAQAEAFCQALDRAGIPYQCRSHESLLAQPLVRSILKHLDATAPDQSLSQRLSAAAAMMPAAEQTPSRALAAALKPVADRCANDLARLRSELALMSDSDLLDPRAERVSLLTLHAAKGLEFRVVFITGCEEGVLPLYFGEAPRDLSEERRLFFVGLTRARARLILTHARRRLWRGSVREMKPTRFLADIEERLLNHLVAPKRKGRQDNRQLSLFG